MMPEDFLDGLDELGSLPTGDPIPEAPISHSQIDFIEYLLRKSTYSEDKKSEIFDKANSGITQDEASDIIDELLQHQCSPLESLRNGDLLTHKDTLRAIKRVVDMDNT